MRPAEQLALIAHDLDYLLARIDGRRRYDGRRNVAPRVTVAIRLAADHCKIVQPGTSGDASRGGTTSTTEKAERIEDLQVARKAEMARLRIGELARRMADDCRELRALVAWATETIHPSKLPHDVACENPSCGEVLEPGRRSGECGRCRTWRSRHDGMQYPKEPV